MTMILTFDLHQRSAFLGATERRATSGSSSGVTVATHVPASAVSQWSVRGHSMVSLCTHAPASAVSQWSVRGHSLMKMTMMNRWS